MSLAGTGSRRQTLGTGTPAGALKVNTRDQRSTLADMGCPLMPSLTLPCWTCRERSTLAPASCPISCRWSMSGKDEWVAIQRPAGSLDPFLNWMEG